MLNPREAQELAAYLMELRSAEYIELATIHDYWRGSQPLPITPRNVPAEVFRLSKMSRVNVCKLIVDVVSQSIHAVGFRDGDQDETNESEAWRIWQANKMDAHQAAIYRAAIAYGSSYATVLPGEPVPVIRGWSPLQCTAAFERVEDEFPLAALIRTNKNMFRMVDDTAVYEFGLDGEELMFVSAAEHGSLVTPVVRFRSIEDLDDGSIGEIAPVIPLQDQMDQTTFELLVAQHFQAFKQRAIMGWVDANEDERLKAGASKLWVFDDPEVRIHEFSQTDLSGYLNSRSATLENMAILSQTPPHQLLGKMVNLSAEALAAAEAGQRRKTDAIKMSLGEAVEATLRIASSYQGLTVDPSAQVIWADTEARSLSATVDALGKLVSMLGVPAQVLWERIPGVTRQDVETWKQTAEELGGLDLLLDQLDGGEF